MLCLRAAPKRRAMEFREAIMYSPDMRHANNLRPNGSLVIFIF